MIQICLIMSLLTSKLWLWATANYELTTLRPSLGSQLKSIIVFLHVIPPRVHHHLPGLALFTNVPKRLGPWVKVSQRGLCLLQQWGKLFYFAHTGELCTRSHGFNVKAYQIAFLFYSPLSADRYRVNCCCVGVASDQCTTWGCRRNGAAPYKVKLELPTGCA